MAKFAIECPNCGKYAEGRTGFFKRKKVECSCGYVIDVKTEKTAASTCPHCGNQVVYDQSKGDQAHCPVCKQSLGTSVDKAKTEQFRCPQCSCALHADAAAATYTCPICDEQIDVQKAIGLAKIAKEGIASVIKYEGDNNTFVWKHPVEDFNIGSQLIVHESQEAIFFRDGQALDTFPSGRYTLETQSIPLINSLYNSQLEPTGMFHSEVYYLNLATQMAIKWGTDSKVRLFDPATNIPIEIGARGEFNIRIADGRKLLLKLVGTEASLDRSQLMEGNTATGYFRSFIMTRVKSHLARVIKESKINILEIDEHLDELSDALRIRLNEGMADYGLILPEFFVEQVQTPDEDPNFKLLKQQHAAMYLKPREEAVLQAEALARREREIVEQQTEAQKKIIDSQAKAQTDVIEAQGSSEAYRLQAQAEAAEMQMKGYTYQQETARQVGLEAMSGGIAGGGSGATGGGGGIGSGLGDVVGLGVALGAMGGVMGLTKDALTPLMGQAGELGQGFGAVVSPGGGGSNNTAVSGAVPNPNASGVPGDKAFGTNATPAVQPPLNQQPSGTVQAAWDCSCGNTGLTANFCPECGTSRPQQSAIWDCNCGKQGNTANFCDNCGTKRPSLDAEAANSEAIKGDQL